MPQTYIDKLAYIHIKNGKVLTALSKGKDTWYISEVKREGDIAASSVIEDFAFVGYVWKEKSSLVDSLIFDDLKTMGLIS